MQYDNVYSFTREEDSALKKFMTNVYLWMAIGIFVTGIVSILSAYAGVYYALASNQLLFWLIFLAEIGLVFYLSANIWNLSSLVATSLFMAYSVLNGITISFIFLIYTKTTIANVFFITAGMFAITSFYAMVTKKDLSKLGNILFMGLIGLIIASIVNIFLKSSMIYWIISYVGVVLFTALTAYDTQKIKSFFLANSSQINLEFAKKLSIYGALNLYIDFINLFLMLLRIFGGGRRN